MNELKNLTNNPVLILLLRKKLEQLSCIKKEHIGLHCVICVILGHQNQGIIYITGLLYMFIVNNNVMCSLIILIININHSILGDKCHKIVEQCTFAFLLVL